MRQGPESTYNTQPHSDNNTTDVDYVPESNGLDTEAGMLSGISRKRSLRSRSLLVHGILQFTMLITVRCALHRCSSRDIRSLKVVKM